MKSEERSDIAVRSNVSLCEYTTFHIGGSAEYFVETASVPELRRAIAWAATQKVPITVLGGGSNVLVSDEGVQGLVIHNMITGRDVEERGTEVLLTVGAGETFDEIVAFSVEKGWWGLENLSCIPGSVGATPIQNIGAYGVEVQASIAFVEAYDPRNDSIARFDAEACAFKYRDSFFKHKEGKRHIVTRVAYRLSKTPHPILHYRDLALWKESHASAEVPTLSAIRDAVCVIRSQKFPDWHVMGTAGSFFKNPIVSQVHFEELRQAYPLLPGYETEHGDVKIPLGWILDHALDLRGYRSGNVGTYVGQALVVVNYGGATATELEAFVQNISTKVFDATHIIVEWEVSKLF